MRPDASENSQINPSTIVRASRAAGRHPHLASVLLQGRKSANIHASSGVIRGIPVNICHVPAGMCEVDWHNPPQRLLVLWLTGEVEFQTSDGNVRRLAAGSVVLAEDTTGKGHISRHPPEGQLVVHVAFA
jgi:hypothetical protein